MATAPIELNRHIVLSDLPELPTPYLPRPRLHRLLDETVARFAITGLVAPVAFGKTTLLVGWQRLGSTPPTAYLALDALDNDPRWFWSRVCAAIEGLRPDGSTGPSVLVLDDLEAVDNPTVVELLDGLLFDLPPGLRVVLASRSEPNLRRGLLRARGRLVDIPPSELNFDGIEVAALLTKFDRHVSNEDITAITAQSEGWVGAVKLAALTPKHEGTSRDLVHRVRGSNPYIADLLNTEVLTRQTEEIRDFLLRTSVLDDLDASLCDAVTGRPASAGILEQLQKRGLVVQTDPGNGGRYRYHRLFRDFLHHHLTTVDPERKRLAHRAAALWFEARGDISAAVHHLLVGDDAAIAVERMLEHGERVAAAGGLETVRTWLEMLPDEVVTRDPGMLAGVSRLCVNLGLRDEALIWLDRARWRVDEESDRRAATEIALLTSYTRGQAGYLRAALDDAHRALRLASHTDDAEATVVAKVHHLLASLYTALDEFDRAVRHQHAAPNSGDDTFPPGAYGAWLSQRAGQLERAIVLSDAHLARTQNPWHEPIAFAARGAARRERNQLREAEADLQAAIELGVTWSRPLTAGLSMIELALLRHAEGRHAEAHELLATARGHSDGTDLRDRVDATEALLWLREGDVERSRRLRELFPTGRATRLLDVRLAYAAGDTSRAIELLDDAEAESRSRQDHIATKLLRARLAISTDSTAASQFLRDAVELGRAEQFVQIFLEDLDELELLLRGMVADEDDSYVFGLLAALASGRGAVVRVGADRAAQLSTREQAVLRYLPTPLPNKDIAAELHVSVNTLKTHLKSINRKLGTTSRAEAVSAARSLALI